MTSETMTATSSRISRRQIIIGGTLLGASGLAFAREPRTKRPYLGTAKLEALVPQTFAGWSFVATSGLILPPKDQLSESIYEQLLTRAYVRPDGRSIMLLIAYSAAEDGVLQVHRPEVCYPASGYRLSSNREGALRLAREVAIPARYLTADGDSRSEQIVYWTRLGRHFPTSWSRQRLAVIEENLAGIIPDGVLVRISMANSDEPALLREFASDLYSAAGPQMRRVLVGER